MGKKSTLSFVGLTGGRRKGSTSKKKLKKAAKYHLGEMKLSKKKFRERAVDDYSGSLKKAHMKYRREHADELADILLSGHLKNPDRYEEKLREMIEDGKLFNREKRGQVKKLAKKSPALFAYTHIVDNFDPEMVRGVMKGKVSRLSDVIDEKAALRVAPLTTKADSVRVLRVAMKIATERDPSGFDAREFFRAIRPKSVTKKEWKHIIVTTVLGIRGSSNNALKDICNYAIVLLGEMPKDVIKKTLRRYADTISKVAESGEKLNFLIGLKDLSDVPRIEKVLNGNPKIANIIGQI